MLQRPCNYNIIATSPNCPPCKAVAASSTNKKESTSAGFNSVLKSAIDSFWRNDFLESYSCACHHLLKKRKDGFAQSIIHTLSLSKTSFNFGLPARVEPPSTDAGDIKGWEILGPINVGKLEVDADPTFLTYSSDKAKASDVALYILQMPSNATVYSDLMPAGTVTWNYKKKAKSGEVRSTLLYIKQRKE